MFVIFFTVVSVKMTLKFNKSCFKSTIEEKYEYKCIKKLSFTYNINNSFEALIFGDGVFITND